MNDGIVTNGTCSWSSVTQIFRKDQPSHAVLSLTTRTIGFAASLSAQTLYLGNPDKK